eukprot:5522050-Amphidinium_carterae.1
MRRSMNGPLIHCLHFCDGGCSEGGVVVRPWPPDWTEVPWMCTVFPWASSALAILAVVQRKQ